MSGLEQVGSENLKVLSNEWSPSEELAPVRAQAEAAFFQLYIAAKHEGVKPEEVHSSRYPDEMMRIFTEGVQSSFRDWWEEKEKEKKLHAGDDPWDIARQAYAAFVQNQNSTVH